jgi:hypothetical protein
VVIILDDFGNFVLEFENENPLKDIIEICNNVVSYVPKAEANEKGKIAWRPKMVVTTSNLDDLLFNKLSNAPGSAKRRGIRMKPFLKPEFAEHERFSEDKYREKFGNLPAVPDAYDIDIQEWGVKKWEYMTFKDGDTKGLSYADALEFHIMKSREHFRKQKDYVKNHGKIREQIVVCEHGRVQSECAKCQSIAARSNSMRRNPSLRKSLKQLVLLHWASVNPILEPRPLRIGYGIGLWREFCQHFIHSVAPFRHGCESHRMSNCSG